MSRLLAVALLASLVFVYGDGGVPVDPYYVMSPPPLGIRPEQDGILTVSGRGFSLDVSRLGRGTYEVVAYWPDFDGVKVGALTLAISGDNVAAKMVLALRDVSVKMVGRHGKNLEGAMLAVNPFLLREVDFQTSPDGTVSLLRMPDGITYQFKASWTSLYGKTAETTFRDTALGLQRRGSIVLPVDDIEVFVVDVDGRPVASAEVFIEGLSLGLTDVFGKVVAASVPLENEYYLTVRKDGAVIAREAARISATKTSYTITVPIYDLTVFVKGTAGQPISGATVELLKNGVTVAAASTDASGKAVFPKIIASEYTVRASYGNIAAAQTISPGTKHATLKLDIYVILMGLPLNFQTTIGLMAAAVLAVVAVAVAAYELVRWRERRVLSPRVRSMN